MLSKIILRISIRHTYVYALVRNIVLRRAGVKLNSYLFFFSLAFLIFIYKKLFNRANKYQYFSKHLIVNLKLFGVKLPI